MLNMKKGDTVILHLFTGLATGVKEVVKCDKKTITIETNKGEAVFDRKTGFQLEPEAKSEKYRNYITEDDGTFKEYRKSKKKSKKTKKTKDEPAKKTKKSAKKSKDDEDDFDDYDEAEEEED